MVAASSEKSTLEPIHPAASNISNSNSIIVRCETKDAANQLQQITPSGVPASIADVPPDGGYGWVCVGCCFLVNACTWGVNSSYGVYLAHYLSSASYPGATPLQYAFIGGLSISQSMLISPISTFLLRRTSTRKVMSLGIFFETTSLVLASFSQQIWHLFLTQGVLFGWGMGFLFTGSVGTISQWFSKKRSVANGICAAGTGLGGLSFSLGTNAIIQRLGTPWAFRIVALCVFVVNSICTMLIRDRNACINPNQRAFDWTILKKYQFLLVLSWGFFSLLGYVVILFSLPDFARSVGLSTVQGSVLNALLNLGMMFGRPLVGFMGDRFGSLNVSGSMTLLSGLLCFVIWMPATGFGVAVLFSLLSGAVCGSFWTTISPVTVEVVGIKDLPSALSLVWLGIVLPTTFSEPIGLYLRRPNHPQAYLYPQLFSGMMYIAASACTFLLRGWMLGETDRLAAAAAAVRGGYEKGEYEDRNFEKVDGGGWIGRWRRGGRWWRYAKV